MPDVPQEPIPATKVEAPGHSDAPGSAPVSPETPLTPEQVPEQTGERLEGKYLEILQKTAPTASPTITKDEEVAATAKSIGALTDEEAKVTRLLELAEQKGVAQSVKVAYALKDYYVLDRMHDELADKLYDGLVEKGLVTEE